MTSKPCFHTAKDFWVLEYFAKSLVRMRIFPRSWMYSDGSTSPNSLLSGQGDRGRRPKTLVIEVDLNESVPTGSEEGVSDA